MEHVEKIRLPKPPKALSDAAERGGEALLRASKKLPKVRLQKPQNPFKAGTSATLRRASQAAKTMGGAAVDYAATAALGLMAGRRAKAASYLSRRKERKDGVYKARKAATGAPRKRRTDMNNDGWIDGQKPKGAKPRKTATEAPKAEASHTAKLIRQASVSALPARYSMNTKPAKQALARRAKNGDPEAVAYRLRALPKEIAYMRRLEGEGRLLSAEKTALKRLEEEQARLKAWKKENTQPKAEAKPETTGDKLRRIGTDPSRARHYVDNMRDRDGIFLVWDGQSGEVVGRFKTEAEAKSASRKLNTKPKETTGDKLRRASQTKIKGDPQAEHAEASRAYREALDAQQANQREGMQAAGRARRASEGSKPRARDADGAAGHRGALKDHATESGRKARAAQAGPLASQAKIDREVARTGEALRRASAKLDAMKEQRRLDSMPSAEQMRADNDKMMQRRLAEIDAKLKGKGRKKPGVQPIAKTLAILAKAQTTFSGYHGSNRRFRRVNPAKMGANNDIGASKEAFWMTSSRTHAGTYAAQATQRQGGRQTVLGLKAKLRNPKVIEGGGKPIYDAVPNRAFRAVLRDAKAAGHDGVIFRQVKDGPGKIDNVEVADVAAVFPGGKVGVGRARAKAPPRGQANTIRAYTRAFSAGRRSSLAKSYTFSFEKADVTGRYVSGWANVCEIDGEPVCDIQGDIIDIEEMRKAAHDYVSNAREAKAMHDGDRIGDVVESVMIDDPFAKAHGITHGKRGWWIGMEVHDPAVRKRVASGELRSFSIGGSGKRTPLEKRGEVKRYMAKPRPVGIMGLVRERPNKPMARAVRNYSAQPKGALGLIRANIRRDKARGLAPKRRERSRLGLKIKAGLLAGAMMGAGMVTPKVVAYQLGSDRMATMQFETQRLQDMARNINKRLRPRRRR